MRDWLRQASVLDRFCAGLVEAVCAAPSGAADGGLTGETFLERLDQTGLPTVALDDRRDWWRYHHLVRDLLRRELGRHLDADGVADLHARAACWFEGEARLEDALRHLLATGDQEQAAALVLRHRDALLDDEHWHRLERWLSLLPRETIDGDPELMLLASWSCEHRGRYGDMIRGFERAAPLIEGVADPERRERLSAEVEAMEAGRDYQAKRFASAFDKARRAGERIPRDS